MINYSKTTIHLADGIISANDADLDLLTSNDISQLAARIMADDPDYVQEATGADNPAYEITMLPALIRWMANQADLDVLMDFRDAWREGIEQYMTKPVMDLLKWRAAEYLMGHGFPCRELNGYDTRMAGRDYICTGARWYETP